MSVGETFRCTKKDHGVSWYVSMTVPWRLQNRRFESKTCEIPTIRSYRQDISEDVRTCSEEQMKNKGIYLFIKTISDCKRAQHQETNLSKSHFAIEVIGSLYIYIYIS